MVSTEQRIAQDKIARIIEMYNGLDAETRDNMTEASVVTQFVEPLLIALGWPVGDPHRYMKELHTGAGRPDLTLIPEAGGTIFVEAKRFGVIRELKEARKTVSGIVTPGQLTLPGMAADRTPQEQQAINYAFENNGTWAILTNFEKLRLFNARRDWLVLSFETPSAYVSQFDYLWQLSYECILNGELDRLSSQRHREDVDADYLSFINEYRQLLAQSIIAHPGANRWAFVDDGSRVDLPLLRDVVQRFLDRLVVARFAEDHFVLKPGTLRSLIESNRNSDYGFSLNIVMRQFFRRFDEQHNSALFAYDNIIDHEADFDEDLVARLVDKLYEARYRAMPADIMGNTYEQYLGTALVQVNGQIETRSNLETRKKQGSYYTPQVIVRYLVDHSLGRTLYGTANGKPDGEPIEGEQRKRYDEIKHLRVLDPACGSGSFLIYAYAVLADFYRAEIARIRQEADDYGDQRAAEGISPLEIEGVKNTYTNAHLPYLEDYPRLILERHLYGVDLDPQAAELAAVNLIFRAMEDMRRMGSRKKLPLILNQNVKCGNALIGTLDRLPEGVDGGEIAPALADLRRLRVQFAQNSHDDAVMAQIEEIEAGVNATLNDHLSAHFEDAAARRPLNWAAAFPECFVDENGQWLGDGAGFDVIVGNPPWEIVKPDLREYYAQFDAAIEHPQTPRKQVEARIRELDGDPLVRDGWEAQKARIEENAAFYKADAAGYMRQYRGDTALHKLFVERVWNLLADRGRLGYVVPSGIYTDLGTKELREMLLNEGHIESLVSLTNGPSGGTPYFVGVHRSFKIAQLVAQRGVRSDTFNAVFRIDPYSVPKPEELSTFLSNPDNYISIRQDSIERFSPDSLSFMEFQTHRDYEITEQIYGNWPLIGETSDAWNASFTAEFHMTNDRDLFDTQGHGLPLYEGKMFHQYDPYFSEPRYWIKGEKGRAALLRQQPDENQSLDYQRPRLVFRDIARGTDERTFISAILPPNVFAGNTGIVETQLQGAEMLFVLAVVNSFCEDYLVRPRIGTHLNMFYVYQLPMPRLMPGNPYFDALVPRAARLTCTTADFAGLWQEVMGEAWDDSSGAIDPAERQRLRDEIDALVAHLYGLSRDDFEHILGTFPLVFPNDGEGHAKKEALLGVYDEIGAIAEGWQR